MVEKTGKEEGAVKDESFNVVEDRREKPKRKFSPDEENLICAITIIGAGIGPLAIRWVAVQIGGLLKDIIMNLPPIIFFLSPSIASFLIVFGLTQNLIKAVKSAGLAVFLYFIILIYLGYRIPP